MHPCKGSQGSLQARYALQKQGASHPVWGLSGTLVLDKPQFPLRGLLGDGEVRPEGAAGAR